MCRNGIKLIKRYIYIYTCILSIQSSLSIICIFLKLICSNVFTAESNFCQIFVHLKAGLSPSEVVWGIKFSRGNDFLSKFSTFSFEKMPQRVAEVVLMGESLNRNNIYDACIGSNKFPQISSTSSPAPSQSRALLHFPELRPTSLKV